MTDLDRRIKLEALVTEREGMLAENQWRNNQSEMMLYGDKCFLRIADRMRALLEPEKSEEPARADDCNCDQALSLKEQLSVARKALAIAAGERDEARAELENAIRDRDGYRNQLPDWARPLMRKVVEQRGKPGHGCPCTCNEADALTDAQRAECMREP